MGPPWTAGDAPGELSGVAAVRVVEEELLFDVAAMSGGRIPVRALYRFENSGEAFAGPLVFVSPFMASPSVSLDGTQVPVTLEQDVPVPPGYAPPRFAPALPPADMPEGLPIRYPGALGREEGATCDVARFDAIVPPGRHDLEVRYSLTPPTHETGSLYRAYILPYVLSPARSWQSFGSLKVDVRLPSGWEAVAAPRLERVEGGLSATFVGLPGDTLAITARPLLAPWRETLRGSAPLLGVALSLLLSTLLGLRKGTALGQKGASGRRAVLTGIWIIFLSAVLGALMMMLSFWLGNLVVDSEHVGGTAAYRLMMAQFLLAPAAILAAVLSGLLALAIARRRAAAK
jgi:hypothetical protein